MKGKKLEMTGKKLEEAGKKLEEGEAVELGPAVEDCDCCSNQLERGLRIREVIEVERCRE